MSLIVHTVIVGLAVVATANAGNGVLEPEPEQVAFVETLQPQEPPLPEPDPAPAPPVDAVAANRHPGRHPRDRPLEGESDFRGRGAQGGAGDGMPGAVPSPVVNAAAPFLPFQVER